MEFKDHTRNQKRMYRIHKLEDKVHDLELMVGSLHKENQELKNLNRIYEEIISDDKENYKLLSSEIKQLGNQQKEFIEYITSYIKLLNDKPDLVELSQKDILEEILSKYKEIMEVKEWTSKKE